jgi:phosphatidylserine decarboxylase
MHDFIIVGFSLAVITALPLAWKWQLGVARTVFAVGTLALAAGLIISSIGNTIVPIMIRAGAVWLLTISAAVAILAYRFYRDPERKIPERRDAIVSPADGAVIYVRHSREGFLPVSTKQGRNYMLRELTKTSLHYDDAVVIGVAMSFLDVHVNRAPIQGRITLQRHFAGIFGSLRLPEMAFENERVTTVLEQNGLQVAVVQIASRLVRQIASFVHENEEVSLGQRIGVIRFGSQVDLVLPGRDDVQVLVTPGQRVCAGESVLAVFKPAIESTERAPDSGRRQELTPEALCLTITA